MNNSTFNFFVFLLAILCLGWTAFGSEKIAGPDGFFHIAYAKWLFETQDPNLYPWMPLSIFSDIGWVDHEFFFHVLLIPFSQFGIVEGVHWAGFFLGCLGVFSFYFYVRSLQITFAPLMVLLLICSGLFALIPFLFGRRQNTLKNRN